MPDPFVCLRVDQQPTLPAAGATRSTCSSCGAAIWLAQTTRAIAEREQRGLVCMPCAGLTLDALRPLLPQLLATARPEVRAEFEAALRSRGCN